MSNSPKARVFLVGLGNIFNHNTFCHHPLYFGIRGKFKHINYCISFYSIFYKISGYEKALISPFLHCFESWVWVRWNFISWIPPINVWHFILGPVHHYCTEVLPTFTSKDLSLKSEKFIKIIWIPTTKFLNTWFSYINKYLNERMY